MRVVWLDELTSMINRHEQSLYGLYKLRINGSLDFVGVVNISQGDKIMRVVQSDEKYFSEHCDQNPSDVLIEIFGYSRSGLNKFDGKWTLIRTHICNSCRELLVTMKPE